MRLTSGYKAPRPAEAALVDSISLSPAADRRSSNLTDSFVPSTYFLTLDVNNRSINVGYNRTEFSWQVHTRKAGNALLLCLPPILRIISEQNNNWMPGYSGLLLGFRSRMCLGNMFIVPSSPPTNALW